MNSHNLKEEQRLLLWCRADSRRHLDNIIELYRSNGKTEPDDEINGISLNEYLGQREQLDCEILDSIMLYANRIEEAVVLFQVLSLPETETLSEEVVKETYALIRYINAADEAKKENIEKCRRKIELAQEEYEQALKHIRE